MLFLNTLTWNRNFKSDSDAMLKAQEHRTLILEWANQISLDEVLERGKDLLFNYYMTEEEAVFSASSMSRVFDYRESIKKQYPEFISTGLGLQFMELLEAIDLLWQETQAPVAELVKAGKFQLNKVNGAATYVNFCENAREMPDLFEATKFLVDEYLNVEILMVLMDGYLIQAGHYPHDYAEKAIQQLRAFAARGKAIGFWRGHSEGKSDILKNLNIASNAIPG